MATRFEPAVQPLDALLSVLPSMPRPILTRLTARLIERLDEIDGDPDEEDDDIDESVEDDPAGFDPEKDMCLAGDDRVCSGSATGAMLICEDTGPGDATDAEDDGQPTRCDFTRRTRARACIPRRTRLGVDGYDFVLEPTVPTKRQIMRRRRGVPHRPRA